MNTRILGTSQITVNQIIKYIEMVNIDRADLKKIVELYKTYSAKYYIRFDVAVLMFLYYGIKTNWVYMSSNSFNLCGIGIQPALLDNINDIQQNDDGSINYDFLESFSSIENFVEAHCQILHLITKKTSGELLESIISNNAPLIAFQDIYIPDEIIQKTTSDGYDVFYLSYIWFPQSMQYDTSIYKSYKEAHENKDTFGWFLEIGVNVLKYIEEDSDTSINTSKLKYFVDFGGYSSFDYAMSYKNKLKDLLKKIGYSKNVHMVTESGRYKIRIGYYSNRNICTKIRLYLYAYGYYGKLNYVINENV